MTLRGLAREIGVSASLISQIETDKAQPSVSTLYAITSALGVGVEDLMTMAGDGHPQGGTGPGGRRRPSVVRRVGPVVTPERARVDHAGLGRDLAAAGPGARRAVEFLLVTYAAGRRVVVDRAADAAHRHRVRLPARAASWC